MPQKKRVSTQGLSWLLVLASAIGGFALGRSGVFPSSTPRDDRVALINAIDKNTGEYAFDKSNLEWILVNIGLTPRPLLKQSLVSTTLTGTVKRVVLTNDKAPILSRHYYVGTPGQYEYEGMVELTDGKGTTKSVLLSPKRMALLRVYRLTGGTKETIGFTEIPAGATVELTETVDLAQSNIDDANVQSVEIVVR